MASGFSAEGENLLPIRDTDPDKVEELWAMVSSTRSGSKLTATGSQTTSKTTESTPASSKKQLSPYDAPFREEVLKPRGIIIDAGHYCTAPFHFKSGTPGGSRFDYYANVRGAPDNAVWVEPETTTLRKMKRTYECMLKRRYNEPEFAAYAFEKLLKSQELDNELLENNFQRKHKAERVIQQAAKPGLEWAAPPITDQALKTPNSTYNFDLRPDGAYWLSLQAFNSEYVGFIRTYTFVLHNTIICPYFTIELKPDVDANEIAENQIAAAGALALYNRFQMFVQATGGLTLELRDRKFGSVKHYGLKLRAHRYEIYCITPKHHDYVWQGCTMLGVGVGECLTEVGLKNLIDWINEIHCWGLTDHGPAVVADVKNLMKAANMGHDISIIDEEDKEVEAEDKHDSENNLGVTG